MSALFPFLLAAGVFGPGWLLGRALGTPAGWTTSFLGSAAILTNLFVVLDILQFDLTPVTASVGLAVICGGLAILAKLIRPRLSREHTASTPRLKWKPHHWFALAPAIGLLAIALKASLHPLSGFDTFFRWDFLAQQMIHHRGLGFYPAATPPDFEIYGWCDGIAPLISGWYVWAYFSLGHIAAWATTPVVLLQAILLFVVVYQLTGRTAGPAGSWAAVAVLSTSGVLLWGVSMGQETALTALSLTAMLLFLQKARERPLEGWYVWAGTAAAVGALAREYGLLFFLFGAIELGVQRARRRSWVEFGIAALALTLPWYGRNWLRTGNPLWPHRILDSFPTNPVHDDYMKVVANTVGIGTPQAEWLAVAGTALVLLACPLLFALYGWLKHRRLQTEMVSIAGVVLLWCYSINQTSAGYTYSLRVLTPVIALCSVAAGRALAPAAQSTRGWLLAALLSLITLDAAARSFFLPNRPFVAWWQVPKEKWLYSRDAAEMWNESSSWGILAAAAGPKKIVVSDPFTHATLIKSGAKAVPLFAPQIDFLFKPTAGYDVCLAQLAAIDVRMILLSPQTTETGINAIQLEQYPFFKELKSRSAAAITPWAAIYDIDSLTAESSSEGVRTKQARNDR